MSKRIAPRIEENFFGPYRADLKPELFISELSIRDRREIIQGDSFRNQLVAICISPKVARRLVDAANLHEELITAAKKVMAGLEARLEAAAKAGDPMPVFNGIADLHDALGKVRQ